jgi:hypothetical protein
MGAIHHPATATCSLEGYSITAITGSATTGGPEFLQ